MVQVKGNRDATGHLQASAFLVLYQSTRLKTTTCLALY